MSKRHGKAPRTATPSTDFVRHSKFYVYPQKYLHIVKIDREIGGKNAEIPESKNEPFQTVSSEIDGFVEPYKPKIRKSGTGCITMINEHLYEGRSSPKINGKRMARNVYAKTREECEEKLAELIKTMKTEIAELKKVQNKG